MPRKTEKPAVQKGGTVVASPDVASEQETPPRRSARTAARGDASSVANRSRRSSTAAQTAASVAESRVTRSSRSNSSRRRSSSPQENVRTRSSRETSSESPASRVKATRRSTSRINYQESEGEEDTSATTERNEEEYLVEDDAEESDSEESNRSRNKNKTVSKSPPKVRGRGRGRVTKAVGKGRGKIAQFEEPSDKENDKISGTDTTESMAAPPRTRRQQKEAEPAVEVGRRTRGNSGQKEQIEPVSVRASRRNEKKAKAKVDTEGESVPLSKSKPVRSTRGRQSYTEEAESPACEVEERGIEQKQVDETPDEEQEEEKRKRKLKTIEEHNKRQKVEKSTDESENIAKSDETYIEIEPMEENSNLEKPLETDIIKDKPDEENLLSKASSTPKAKMELVSEQTVIVESISKEETTASSEEGDRDVKDDEPMEVQSVDDLSLPKVSEDKISIPVIQEEKMECDNDDGNEEEIIGDDDDEKNISGDDQNTLEIEDTSEKTDTFSRVSTEDFETTKDEQKQVKEIEISSKNNEEEEKGEHISTDEIKSVIKEHKVAFVNPVTTTPVTSLSGERTTDDQTAPTNLTSEIISIGDTNVCEKEHDTRKEQKSEVYSAPHWEKELSTSVSLSSSESSFLCPAQTAELSSPQEVDPKPLDSSETSLRENNIAHSAHVLVSESTRAAVESNNSVGVTSSDALSVNGADLCVGKSAENALDMSKGSDDSVSESERITSDLSLHPATTATTTVLECTTTKTNGTHHNISTSTEPPPFALTNRKYIVNASLSEDTRSRLKSTTFSLISFNMGAMRNESAYTEKLGLEIRRTEADIICLQEIKMTFYSESLEHVMNNFGYRGLLSIPENRSRGLGIFYNTNTFNLIRQAGIPLQKVIDQDLETSSLENNDKAAVRDFLEKCGHMLVAQLKSVIADRTLTIANVLFPPCDIGTHALQMSSSVREVVSFLDDIARPHVICGAFNITEGGVAYQLLREGYLNNEMIEELQQRKDVRLPGKENDTLVNLLWKAFQHPSSNLRSCYAAAMGHELRLGHEKSITSPDLLWYSSDSLETLGVLDVGPAGENLDHVALKADIAYAC